MCADTVLIYRNDSKRNALIPVNFCSHVQTTDYKVEDAHILDKHFVKDF